MEHHANITLILSWIVMPVVMVWISISRVSGMASRIPEGYDASIRPNYSGAPLDLRLNLYIESMGTVKESTMDFTMTMFLRQFWQDSRLRVNDSVNQDMVSFKGDNMNRIWTPDIFFLFEKDSTFHEVTVPNRMIRLYPNGTVLLSTRVSLTLSCNMDLTKFPMDTQTCHVIMMSYAYTTREVKLFIDDDSLEIDKDLQIPRFRLKDYKTNMSQITYGPTGSFSMARITFSFSRHIQSYILTVYIPSSLLVVIAWLSFWIDAKAAPARVSLGIMTVLTITTMTAGVQETMPLVTYAKALDVWLAVCLVFVFLALMEYACANYLVTVENKRKLKHYTKKLQNGINEKVDHVRIFECHYDLEVSQRPGYREPLTADQLDRICRFLFPAVFIVFNAVYWPFYLI